MADQEVIKHTKKVYSIWSSKAPIWHKLKEFAIEILIIVFAVSLSIWLHDRSEHTHQQNEVREFLMGLKLDLVSDSIEMKSDLHSFDTTRKAFHYITTIKKDKIAEQDSIAKYSRYFQNSIIFLANNGRFEGFKSSGKIGAIENIKLQNAILDLYQESIPNLQVSTSYYASAKAKWLDFYFMNLKRLNDSTNNSPEVLAMDPTQNLAKRLIDTYEIRARYNSCIDQIRVILSELRRSMGTS